MKVPVPPPNVRQLARHTEGGRLFDLLEATRERLESDSGEYLSWDKLRHLAPPGDLLHEEWWWATKTVRSGSYRRLPSLLGKDGTPMVFSLPDSVLQAIEAVASQASGQIAIDEQVTNPATRDRYLVSSLIEEAITSSQLEGATTTRAVAKDMLRSGRAPRDVSERMIQNNFHAMQHIVERQHQAITPEAICELHGIVTDGTLKNARSAGRLQEDDANRVAVWGDGRQKLHQPPAVAELPERLQRLCDFANHSGPDGYVPAVLRAIAIHFQMGYDHYFEDGNGRTARAVFYWAMLREGFWLTEYLTISRILKNAPAQYARSFLLTEQDDGDLTYFFIYHLGVIERAIGDLRTYLARRAEELRSVQGHLRTLPHDLNYRQLALVESALREPGVEYSVRTHARAHRVADETARQDLLAMESMGLLGRLKRGRMFVWRAAPDLAARLSEGANS